MKIDRITVYAVRYTPIGGAIELSGGRRFTEYHSAVVRIDTDDGLTGWGEHASAPIYMTALHKGALGALEVMAPALIGLDPRELGIIRTAMDGAMKGHDYAKSAIDIACWDILGKALDAPVAKLLGGIYRERFPLINAAFMDTPEAMKDRSDEVFDQGFRVLQMKVGGDWHEDVRRIEKVYESAQRFDTLIVDANGYWLQHEALLVANAVRDLDIILEQPCRELENNLAVRKRTSHPFVLDESLDSLQSVIRAQAVDGFDCAMLKLSRFGGLTPLRMARDMCITWGKAVTMEDMAGSEIIAAVSAHLAASTPPQHLVAGSFVTNFVTETIGEGVRQENGYGFLPTGPGLGVTIHEETLGDPVMVFTA